METFVVQGIQERLQANIQTTLGHTNTQSIRQNSIHPSPHTNTQSIRQNNLNHGNQNSNIQTKVTFGQRNKHKQPSSFVNTGNVYFSIWCDEFKILS